MSPVFSARRRADEFDSLVEAAASGQRVEDARFAELLEVVGTLRSTPAPEARPEFVADLRSRLMTAAAEELVQVAPTPAERRPSSTTRIRSHSPAWRPMAAALSGCSQRRSTTLTFQPLLASMRRAARRLIGTPLPKLKITRSVASGA